MQRSDKSSCENYLVWVVYRETDPWPIRHFFLCKEACDEETVKNDYYRDYYKFSDDCFRGFSDLPSAQAFEAKLKEMT